MRIAIISDIHEDIVSLRRVINKIEKKGADQLVCLGDISGFSVPYYKYENTRDASACLSLLREKSAVIVPGNHDYHSARIIPRESAAFDFPSNWYELDNEQRATIGNNEIWLHEENDLEPNYSSEDIQFLRTLPEYFVQEHPGVNGFFSHYVFPNMSGFRKGFYTRAGEFSAHFELMQKNNCNIAFTGHTHIRGFYTVSNGQFRQYAFRRKKLEHFPVCVGIQPVTNSKKRSGFCIFEPGKLLIRAVRC